MLATAPAASGATEPHPAARPVYSYVFLRVGDPKQAAHRPQKGIDLCDPAQIDYIIILQRMNLCE